ncbi:MAG: hypothetical protein PHO67_08280 [Candidatus Omnitrophica bacterium]|nr:hypothetical protein [Candidatus Omnitrophota bacterium]
MTKVEALAFLNSLVAQPVNMITLDPVRWEAFKALVVPILTDPTLDPKYRTALEAVNSVVDSALG